MLGRESYKTLTSPDYGKPPEEQNLILQQLGYPHVNSFNYMLSDGLDLAIKDLRPVEVEVNGMQVKVSIGKAKICAPAVPPHAVRPTIKAAYPNACRQGRFTYKGTMLLSLDWSVDGVEQEPLEVNMGEVPIMLKSDRCHLSNMTPKQLIESGEHEQEWGGYFIAKGQEKLVRMTSMMRRNYPAAISRSSYSKRGARFSKLAVVIRSVKLDQSAVTNSLHYLTDGTCKMMFQVYNMSMYQVPLILLIKCLTDHVDYYIFKRLTVGYEDNSYYLDCVQNMLRLLHEEGLHTQDDCKSFMGQLFRQNLRNIPTHWTDHQITDYLLTDMILVHLDSMEDKFNLVVCMTQKLYYVQSTNLVENQDHLMLQEVLLGGHLYNIILKEKLRKYLVDLGLTMRRLMTKDKLLTRDILRKSAYPLGFGRAVETIILTGNMLALNNNAINQNVGMTVTLENINRIRYMAHFRAVHRGASFMKMRTTEVRQLSPDAWGFYCPVHTPDGAPCGLLNHLTSKCTITAMPDRKLVANIERALCQLGMVPIYESLMIEREHYLVAQLDGRVVGYVKKSKVGEFERRLRSMKMKGVKVPDTMEICMVPEKKCAPQFPGIFLFTGPARMMRPLINLATGNIEMVGTFEQNYLNVSVTPREIYSGITTHLELCKTDILSHTANLIPLPDCNQSPRNMYQCQMAKQTMGTPCHNFGLQTDKIYRLTTPASPLFRTTHFDDMDIDSFPMGTNAIVAVISYTGYDMEDAMIINKSSAERGFANGTVYKTDNYELSADCELRRPTEVNLEDFLDEDGLPFIGRRINGKEPLFSYYDTKLSKYVVNRWSGGCDKIYVDKVRIVPGEKMTSRTLRITYRIERPPTIGDKFASRAGQKGICSMLYPAEDLPFTESGLTPDIIFNPHSFPSRMTIAMMIETMAGKSAAIHGFLHDATPFKFNEKDTAIDYFGRLLEAGGYDYYGTETMFSGIDGRQMEGRIFFGVVHYQRLRHMVDDKWQVRSTGVEDALTHQPIQGKKRGGGIRFGEMERDALIGHGTTFMLKDRLMNSSDKAKVTICTKCNNMLSVLTPAADEAPSRTRKLVCAFCQTSEHTSLVEIPYVYKLLTTELASCNINLQLNCKDAASD